MAPTTQKEVQIKNIDEQGRFWPCRSVSQQEYEETNSIVLLYLKDPSRIDLGECLFANVVEYIPFWIHPNYLTMCTLVCNTIILVSSFMVPIVSTDMQRAILCLIAGICNFGTMTFDCLDGMHARATKQTSELGSLLDHWLDSFGVAMNAGAVALAFNCDTLAIDSGVLSAVVTYHSQLIIYHYCHDFPPVSGVEAQMGCSLGFFLCGVAYSFQLYRFIHISSWILTIGAVFTCAITVHRFWPRYTKSIMKQNFCYFLVIFFGYCFLHELSYICTVEFILISIAISNRINGSLVIHTLAEKNLKHFDHVFIIGVVLCFVENYFQLYYYFQHFLTFLIRVLSFSKTKLHSQEQQSSINELHFVPWFVITIALIHSIQEFVNYVSIIVNKDKKNNLNKNINKEQ